MHTTTTTDPAAKDRTTSRRAGVLLAGLAALTGAALIGTFDAGVANAATLAGPYTVTASPYLNEHTSASTSAPVAGTIPHGASVYISCQTTGSYYNGTDIWDQLPNGLYVTDDLVTTPVYDGFSPGIANCANLTGAVGRTVSYNEGAAGQCTWWAINEFHGYTGLYPALTNPANNGNAEYWAINAAYNGWTVSASPRVDSIVVFPPYVNGALSDGHVAWVTAVGAGTITFTEMNGTAGPYRVDTRTVVPASSVRYILAP